MFDESVRDSDRDTLARQHVADAAFGPYGGPGARVTDRDIRIALAGGSGPSLVREGVAMEEVRCWRGYARADYLIFSDEALLIVEIKSDADSLRRLSEQVRVYTAFADRAALVVGWALAAAALKSIPWWWEVWLAERPPTSVTRLILLREGEPNPEVSTFGLASMLPVNEARKIGVEAGLPVRDSRSKELREALAEHLSIAVLRNAVMEWLNRLSVQRASQQS